MALVHHWALGEASGTRVDSIGELDLSPLGADSVAAVPGLIGDALNADVTFSSLTSGLVRALDIDGANAFSVSGAFRFTNAAGSDEAMITYASATVNMFLVARLTNGRIQVTLRNSADTDYVIAGTTVTLADTWYYVNVTFLRNGTLKLYVNGVEEASTAVADAAWRSALQSPRFLLASRQGVNTMKGRIDEVSVDDVELSSSAITALYNSGSLTDRPVSYTADYTSGLTNYYNLEQASGNRVDLIGGNTMTVTDDAGSAPGILNNGMVFDGSANIETLSPMAFSNADQCTVMLWIKFNNAPSVLEVIARSSEIPPANTLLSLDRLASGVIDLEMADNNGTTEQILSTITPGTGSFHHLAITYRRNGIQKLYINATALDAPIRFRDDFPTRDLSGNFAFKIGREPGAVGPFDPVLDAVIDEVAVYSRALTTGDIKGYYNGGSPPSLAPPTGGGQKRRTFSNGFYRSSS